MLIGIKTGSLAFIFFVLVACFHYQEGSILKANKGYIRFVGNFEGVTVKIDDSNSVKISGKPPLLYEINPGKHTVNVYKDGKLIIQRIIFIDNQIMTEVEIP
jgi:hypothetical protein